MDPFLSEAALTAFGLGLPETTSPLTAVALAWKQAHAVDSRRYPRAVSLLRSARRAQALLAPGLCHALARNPAFASHAAAEGEGDPLFFLSHRHYLARGLTPAQRIRAAATHYQFETRAFSPALLHAVRFEGGLTLWQREVDGRVHDIRLCQGNDIAHEGGLSLVLGIEGARICVLSFSMVPANCVGAVRAVGDGPILFVTRKQLTRDHGYQTAFCRAFQRATPASLCIGALQGIAGALRLTAFAGIAGLAHPALTPELSGNFRHSYDDFWRTLGGQRVSDHAFLIPVPVVLPPLAAMDAAHRKRARARRRHADGVETAARAAITPLLRHPAATTS